MERVTVMPLPSLVLAVTSLFFVNSASSQQTPRNTTSTKTVVITVVGAAGESTYGTEFAESANNWKTTAERADANWVLIAPEIAEGAQTQRERLRQAIESLTKQENIGQVWIVLLGHGTYDGTVARFNLAGPDISAEQLADLIEPIAVPTAVINCSSSSAPFINALSGANRVVITATKSGSEHNFARFGRILSETCRNGGVDLDKDGVLSLQEAFLEASRRTEMFYRDEKRLATEHALIDDNGDRRGTPAAWFDGYRVDQGKAKTGQVDGRFSREFAIAKTESPVHFNEEQLARRNEIEQQIEQLRANRPTPRNSHYFSRLEELLLELAKLYEQDASSTN